MPAPPEYQDPATAAAFRTTHWSVVLAAGGQATVSSQEALAHLCHTYWYPLYAFVRRKGHGPHDAQDLTQAFFARLLEKNYVAQADRERGRFRTFLLAALTHFLADDSALGHTELGARLGLTVDTVKQTVHRMRRRYRELFREEIAQTVAGPGEVDDELKHLFAVLSG